MQPTPDDMQGIQEGKNATDPEKAEGQNAIDLCTDVTLDADTTDAQKPTHTDTRPMQSTKDTSMTKNQIATQNATDTTQNATNMKEKTQNAIDLGTGVSQAAADINTDQSSAATTQQEEHKHPADQQITDHAQNATNTKEKSQNAIDFGTGVSQAAVDLNTDQSSAAAIRQEGHKQSADQQITDHTQNATDLESNEPPTQALDTEHSQNGSVHDPEHAQNATDMELAQILAAAETAEDTLKEGTDSMVDASGSNGMGTRDNTPNIIPSNTPDISITDGEPDVGIGRKRSRTAEGDLQGSDIDDDRTETDRHMHTVSGAINLVGWCC
ncbi:hypothetical protein SARC_12122 [Sphaeroforma arctica JP610]|uniref:Uncharacterized protein n=1 Tax=Sphaeroforma arctica JP610 TaxID=667725 RepID=A0A0L0FF00_9EUKA|nr:hypothetical protein SARC_12122 [Sphaeroforma arctica JP610]KNC75352.1 hypothetical protein SARC_12122 [Sphaeroforma arctica JP610]|eukprot:XP_014149254.1 hypothetical protein SARC_12122 [Sphaeroforma arctica JP610]